MKYRHEFKHRVSMADYYVLRNRLKHIMKFDPNSDKDGKYIIRSLYFDNYKDKALREKIDGLDVREKFRIRYYNFDTSFIRLEKKMKRKGLNKKISENLTYEEARAIINTDWNKMQLIEKPLVMELCSKMKSEQLRGRTIVQYIREAYVYKPGNVRITFDSQLKTGLFSTDLFNENAPLSRLMEETALLEVKFDEFIPDNILKLLQLGNRTASAFSKYAVCRTYG